MENLTIRRDNKLDKSDYLRKLLYKGFMGFSNWFDSFMVVTGRISEAEAPKSE